MTVPFVREMQDRNRSRRFWESRSARSTDSRRTVAGTTVPRTKCGGYVVDAKLCARRVRRVCRYGWIGEWRCAWWKEKKSSICYRRRYECLLELSSSLRKILIVLSICFKRNSHVMNSPKVSKRTFASYNFQTHNSFPWVKKSRTKFLNNKYRFAHLLSTLSYFCTN